jgi:antagonist of KipI
MAAVVLQPGWQSTLQDGGRAGHRACGVGTGGPMDDLAFQMSNALVNNPLHSTALEIFSGGLSLAIQETMLMAVSGFARILLDDLEIPINRPFAVKEGQVLQIEKSLNGLYAYLSVAGTWKADPWLGSFSTDLRARQGGFGGRALQKTDLLLTQHPCSAAQMRMIKRLLHQHRPFAKWGSRLEGYYLSEDPIKLLRGPEYDLFPENSLQILTTHAFILSPRFNRMGLAFHGPSIRTSHEEEMLSSGVVPGTLQCSKDGSLYLLMADAQTTGGYPRPGIVIPTDLHRCAQLKPGNHVNFEWIPLQEAQSIRESYQQEISAIFRQIQYQFQ